jgi:hypothetical protein
MAKEKRVISDAVLDLLTSANAKTEKESRQAEEEARAVLNSADPSALIGQTIGNEGIFIGRYSPRGLSHTFNVFAAPQNLTDETVAETLFRYVDAVKRVAQLKNWCGHDGAHYKTDKEFLTALQNGSYNNGWVIPPRDLLEGGEREFDSKGGLTKPHPDNIYAHVDKGDLKAIVRKAGRDSDSNWYWSSTADPYDPSVFFNVNLSGGNAMFNHKKGPRLNCWPVRFVPVAGGLQ